tara:strand:+ start:79939 stop:80526 length:588 start_codon:yes stop_codon:yes gene_type:complete
MSVALQSNIASDLLANSESQLLLTYTLDTILFILISVILFVIIATPVVLFYSSIDNYYKWKKNQLLVDVEFCCDKRVNHPTYISKVCEQYRLSMSRFIANSFGLIAWNVFSLLYISIAFDSFKLGVLDYFAFPFEVLESFSYVNTTEVISSYSSNWIYMLIVLGATVLFFQIGRIITPFFIKRKLEVANRKLSVA